MSELLRSANDEAFVLGVRPGQDVVVSLAQTNAPPGTPWYLAFAANAWSLPRADTNTSAQRGLGTITPTGAHGVSSRGVRLLDSGGFQLLGDELVPANARSLSANNDRWFVRPPRVWGNGSKDQWFFLTPSSMTWPQAQSYARSCGGNLVTITNDALNAWLAANFNQAVWIGLYYTNRYDPWLWASGWHGGLRQYWNWAPGEPDEVYGPGYPDFYVEMYPGGLWNDTNPSGGTRFGVVEVGSIGPHFFAAESPVYSRLPWRGHSLCAGDLRLTTAVSILSATLADQNRNNLLDATDQFVLTEYVFTGTNVFVNDVQRIPLTNSVLAPSYGLACVDVLSGNQQALFTAEPDGRIFSWSATNGTTALQRQLFSAHDQGKAWHALAAVRTREPGQSLLGLRVDPATPNRCDVVLWPPVSQLSAPPDYPQTAPITQILPLPNAGTNLALVDLRLWDGEANTARVTLQYQRLYETAWLPATVDLTGSLATYPTGITHRVTWNAALDLGPGFTNTVQLRARAQDISLVGDWSGVVAYQVQTVVGNNPQAHPDNAITAVNQWVDIPVLANDTVENSAPKLIYSVQSPSLYNGTVVTNLSSTVRYTPAPGFVGTDQFSYILTDGAAYSQATVTVAVTPAAILLAAPALDTNWFSLWITGPVGAYQVLISTNLTDWSSAGWVTNTTGTVPFAEQVPTDTAARFYRALRVP